MSKFKVSVSFPERLQISEFSTVSEAMVEFVESQKQSVGACGAVVERINPDGSKQRLVDWED